MAGIEGARGTSELREQEGRLGTWGLLAACAALVVAAVTVAALFVVGAPGFTRLQTPAAQAASTGANQVDLAIVTNAGAQGNEPAYVPSSFSIPANQPVTITVTDMDGNTPLPPSLASHSKVTGVAGGVMSVTPISATLPNQVTGKPQNLKAISPEAVGHTFTIPSLGINVPIAGHSRTSFTIDIPKAGSYHWQCFDPCGSGPNGFGGAMAEPGFMSGVVTVTS